MTDQQTRSVNKQALTDLLERVEAGGDQYGFGALGGPTIRGYADSAHNGSLDAAKTLHEAVLPFGYDSFEVFSISGDVVLERTKPVDRFYGFADGNPARAWLIAILKALIAKDEEENA